MKTLDEVIAELEDEGLFADALEWLKGYKAHIELDKLRDKCEAKNDPLTWSELKQMEGKPVWIEYNRHLSEKAQALSKGWFVIFDFRPLGETEMMSMTNNFVFTLHEQQDDVWQAYRKEHHDH